MNRIKRLVRPESEPLNWKMALPILGLSAACVAFYANAQGAPAAAAAPAAVAAPATPVAPQEQQQASRRVESRMGKSNEAAYALVVRTAAAPASAATARTGTISKRSNARSRATSYGFARVARRMWCAIRAYWPG